METMTETLTATHETLPIAANDTYWRAIGYSVASDGSLSRERWGMEPLLAIACGRGLRDEAAIAWAAQEHARRDEERSHGYAAHEESTALRTLAAAIQQAGDAAMLERILSRVSERTRHAIRQQLGLNAQVQ